MALQSTNKILSNAGVQHIAIRARDFDKSLAFYCDGLGFTVGHSWGDGDTRAALLNVGDGNYLELFAAKPGQVPDAASDIPESWPYLHLALRSTDIEHDTEIVRALGCKITVEPKMVQVNGKTIHLSFFLGPDGEVIEFFNNIAAPGETSM